MSEQSPGPLGPNSQRPPNNNRRRHHHGRQRSNNPNANAGGAQVPSQDRQVAKPQQPSQGSGGGGQSNNNNRRRPQHHHQSPRPDQSRPTHPRPDGQRTGFNLDKVYEKYLNLLDQHIIARRKYHDLFYRADPSQKNKLEKNFYNTLYDLRDFEDKLAPDVKTLFEKRNNGNGPDRTYTSNHEIPIEGDKVPTDIPPAEPHLLRSQIAADYSNDKEESVGTADDYLRYKNL